MNTVYRSAQRETTVWDDTQRRLGNLPPLPEQSAPAAFAPACESALNAAALRCAPAAKLEALEDDVTGEDDRALEELRRDGAARCAVC